MYCKEDKTKAEKIQHNVRNTINCANIQAFTLLFFSEDFPQPNYRKT